MPGSTENVSFFSHTPRYHLEHLERSSYSFVYTQMTNTQKQTQASSHTHLIPNTSETWETMEERLDTSAPLSSASGQAQRMLHPPERPREEQGDINTITPDITMEGLRCGTTYEKSRTYVRSVFGFLKTLRTTLWPLRLQVTAELYTLLTPRAIKVSSSGQLERSSICSLPSLF